MAADNPLGLILPEQSPPREGSLLRPKEVAAWIERLPMASVSESAHKLWRALQDINRTKMPPAARVQIAELLTAPTSDAIATLQRQFLDAAFPLSEKGRDTEDLCAKLHDELALAYKIVVSDIAMGRIGTQERKVLIVALFRAVSHLSDRIQQATLVYQDCPDGVWRELHNLFIFADSNKWSSTRIRIPGGGEEIIATLRDVYVQTLLLATAAPFRLRQRDIRLLRPNLMAWTGLVRFSPLNAAPSSASCFVVQLKKDLPPLHASLFDGKVEPPALEMNTEPLTHTLRQIFEQLPPDVDGVQRSGAQEQLSRSAIRSLIQTWGTAPKRQFTRTRLNFELNIAVGLSTLYHLLSGGSESGIDRPSAFDSSMRGHMRPDLSGLSFDSSYSSDSLEAESSLTLVPLDDDGPPFSRGYSTYGAGTGRRRQPEPAIWQESEPVVEPSLTNTLRTLNESAGGYCVNWKGRRLPGVKIGEIIGIRSPGDDTQYGVAVVRWMHNVYQEGLQLGLQLIALSALAVTASAADRRPQTPTQCLLVPELKTTQRPASLIVPILPFKVGQSLNIRHEETEQRVRLLRLLESTGTFAQFQFEYA